MRTSRINEIEQYIHACEVVSLEELCQQFSISISTLRRDIVELQKRGSIQKVYGGVRKNPENLMLPFHARSSINTQEKDIVCALASRFVQEGDIIFIDTGSTTGGLVDHINCPNVTVVTNNIDTVLRSIPRPNITLYSLQGLLNRSNKSFSPVNSDRIFVDFNIGKAFMAASGLSLENGISHSDPLENATKRAAIQKARQKYLMVDSTKFGRNSVHSYASFSDFNCIVTDQKPPDSYLTHLNKRNIECIYEK